MTAFYKKSKKRKRMIMEYTGKEEKVKTWVIKKDFYFVFYNRVKIYKPGEIKFLKIRLIRRRV